MSKKEIELSPEFKTQTTKAIISIALFLLTYIFLFLLAIGLTAICVYGGIMLIIAYPRLITLAFGIGLASLGVLILIFLIKFIFKSHKVDRSHLTEISKKDEPELYNLIDEIVQEVGTSFPKKIYLSADVNAGVFYDSSFWSMFFPIKKNLQIGMGLVNAVTKEELKSILAHEFGHFSQRTMKVGSYVYNLNQVIFNMLYENESFDKLIQGWANISGYFSIFMVIAFKLIEGIQWVLRKMYDFVNKNYLALSREMEFHADEIAANITGFKPLKNSLLRMNLVDHSYNFVLGFYEGKISENQKSENIFREHSFVINFLAKDDNIPFKNGLPIITKEELNKFNKSKLVIKDQWASHPSTKERVENLEKINIASKQVEQVPANSIFKNIEQTQKELTKRMFELVNYSGETTIVNFVKFQEEFKKDYTKNTFSKIYNGYYDNKNPIQFELNGAKSIDNNLSLEDLFSNKKNNLNYTAIALHNDIETLKQIADKTFKIKSFDYDGKKYKQKESQELLSKINSELKEINEQIKQNDIKIFVFFSKSEQLKNSSFQLETLYKDFFEFDKEFDDKYEIYTNLTHELQFVNQVTKTEQISLNFLNIESLELKLKGNIKEFLEGDKYQSEITKEIKENFEHYLSRKWRYFGNEKYYDKSLEVLFTAIENYSHLLSRGYFLMKKELLNYQEKLL